MKKMNRGLCLMVFLAMTVMGLEQMREEGELL